MKNRVKLATVPRESLYQVFMLVLCVLALAVFATGILVPLDPSTRRVLAHADLGICIIFFGDFAYSLATAENRWVYFVRWGWIDLLSSVPMVDALRLGRVARIMRVVRVLRGMRATKIVATFLLDRRAESAFLAVALISLVLVIFSALAVIHFEADFEGSNINSADDALWWAFVTVTTVGYGDRFPVSPEGRLLAALLMTAGVGLFGTFSGFVAAWFLTPSGSKQGSELAEIRKELAKLRELIERGGAESGSSRLDGTRASSPVGLKF